MPGGERVMAGDRQHPRATFTTAAVATTVAISAGVPPGEQGMAAALRQTAYQLGVALGVAVFVSLAASHASALLAHARPPTAQDAFTAGLRLALGVLGAVSVAGGVAAFALLRSGGPGSARGGPAPRGAARDDA